MLWLFQFYAKVCCNLQSTQPYNRLTHKDVSFKIGTSWPNRKEVPTRFPPYLSLTKWMPTENWLCCPLDLLLWRLNKWTNFNSKGKTLVRIQESTTVYALTILYFSQKIDDSLKLIFYSKISIYVSSWAYI